MKRLSISTLFISILAHCLIGILFFSCSQDDGQSGQPSGSVTTGRTIRKEIVALTLPLESAEGEGATRATTQIPLSEDEARIHSLWVLQFGGTDAGSLLIKKTKVDVGEINPVTGAFFFDFEELAGGGYTKVWLLANFYEDATVFDSRIGFDDLVENTTTLSEFEDLCYSYGDMNEDAVRTIGLPMVASQIFDVTTTNPAPFTLKSLLAKVVFSYDTTKDFPIKGFLFAFENSAGRTQIRETAPGNAAVRPDGAGDYAGEYTLSEDGTWNGEPMVLYVHEDLAGRMPAITKETDRGGKEGVDVPEGAMYAFLMDDRLSRITFNFYLGDGTPQDFNVVRHHQYNVHVTLRGLSSTDKRIELNTANCYEVNQFSKNYSFHATVMGNGAVTPAAGANAPAIVPATLRPASAKVLWEQSDPAGTTAPGDVVKNVSLSSAGLYINFTTGTKHGNAVIGALDEGGNIIWSWHIWHPETYTSTVQCYTPYPTASGGRTFDMMDRNLGAFNNNENDIKAYGLMYQWGRKDPFPGATELNESQSEALFEGCVGENGYSFTSAEGGITVQGAVQNPMTYYYHDLGNWLQTPNYNLWGNPNANASVFPNPDRGSKSIYDPCPYGYRVPSQDAWGQLGLGEDVTWVTNGGYLNVGAGGAKYFYPAAGRRLGDIDKGALGNVGEYGYGYYWVSTQVKDWGGGALYFFLNGEVYNDNYYPFSNAFSVRCMYEY